MILGIDFSTVAVDVALLDDDTDHAEWRRYPLPTKPRDSFLAARLVRDGMPPRSLWRDLGVWLVGIEKPYSQNRQTLAALMRIQGAVLACLPAEVTVVEMAPNEWQPLFCGGPMPRKSEDRKARIRNSVVELGFAPGISGWNDDAMDAYGLAWSARELNARAVGRAA